ncbi:hypothetical protein PAP_06985 [Palaeococcus pacificus DY20341]|uniref:HTH arsR-type domain-containing protein n=1 Tax=Palaeococcus pacificus DY20341 TaxID=1343739 RepID=A0A075LTU0_9EURY|nr:winged helix-turn-helix domain-containing protein [Palaeococcus pacificus]AIF69789.1 hypothetical protein PAP_06985 [Palaeococcus pacificus DY20341]
MDVGKMLKLIVSSTLRHKILFALSSGPKALGELQKIIGSTKSSISHSLNDLEEENLITQDPDTKKYMLTNTGYLTYLQMARLVDTLETVKNFEEFWLNHDLSGIPVEFLERIGDLKDSQLYITPPEHLTLPHEAYMKLVKTSKWIKGVSPILFSDYPKAFMELASTKNVDIEIITTRAVYEKLIELAPPEAVELVKDLPNVKIYILEENPKVAFTVTNNFLSFGLFFPDGRYDMMADLISNSEKARKWGIALFQYYKEKAKRVL